MRRVQARLRQIDWFQGDVTGVYADDTTEAVRGFQAKRGFPVTGEVDQRTLDRLHAMTTEPTEQELAQRGAVDQRQRARSSRPALQDRPSGVHRQVEQHPALGGRR